MTQEQVIIATRDIPAPGHDDPTVVAFRAGDTVPATWADQHKATLKELAGDGPELIRRVSPAKAPEASAKAQAEQAGEPSRVTPTQP